MAAILKKKVFKLMRPKSIETDPWIKLISENAYIKSKKQSCSDPHSYCTLVSRPLTQSQNIMLGTCMERLFNDAVGKHAAGWQDASKKFLKKGDRQKDHIWVHEDLRKIIYAEQKNNINLDTEKSVSTKKKVEEVSKQYEGYEIICCILAARYLTASEPLAQSIIKTKYQDIMVLGINDYFDLFELSHLKFETYDAYKKVILKVVDTKFTTDVCSTTSSS